MTALYTVTPFFALHGPYGKYNDNINNQKKLYRTDKKTKTLYEPYLSIFLSFGLPVGTVLVQAILHVCTNSSGASFSIKKV